MGTVGKECMGRVPVNDDNNLITGTGILVLNSAKIADSESSSLLHSGTFVTMSPSKYYWMALRTSS